MSEQSFARGISVDPAVSEMKPEQFSEEGDAKGLIASQVVGIGPAMSAELAARSQSFLLNMSVLVGKKAPSFSAKAVMGETIVEDFSLDQFIGKKYVIFFFYPKDFTFVCPTELHRFQEELEEFESRGVAVVGCSTDSEFSHWAWLQTPKSKGGIEGVKYPLVADVNKTIADAYDVLAGDYGFDEDGALVVNGELVAYRGLFLIDKEGIVRHQVVNDMPLGRSIREALRVVDALQHFEGHGEVCPMDWSRGDKAMKPDHEGVSGYLAG